MRVLIADDEPIARQILREHLEDLPGVEIAGEAASGIDAVASVARLKPDVVFLDLEMPGLDGFSVARSLTTPRPAVIFVTAYDRHALDAFNIGAVDYVLKPVRRERLAAALAKVPKPPPRESTALRKIAGHLGSDIHLLDPGEVVAFRADGEIVHILATTGRFLANQTLRALEERLPSASFRRVHRATIINTDHIRKISPLSSKRWLLKMSNGLEVIVSKRMAGSLRDSTVW
jgi:DNA-binding LytR/AlgR family response regulator